MPSSATGCGRSRLPRSRSPPCTVARSSTRPRCRCGTAPRRPCFRREAGAAGKDTRGLLRVHEFDKTELFAYCTEAQAPARSPTSSRGPRQCSQGLGLQYRVLDLCTGDLGHQNARTFDLEVYAPGVDKWLEVSSVSWYRDYQARRANVRYRPDGGRLAGRRPHRQRLGPRLGACCRRGARDLAPAGRLDRAARVLHPYIARDLDHRAPAGDSGLRRVEPVADAAHRRDEAGTSGRPRSARAAASRGRRASSCRRRSRCPTRGR